MCSGIFITDVSPWWNCNMHSNAKSPISVKKKYFFESYFFPNLKNNYWDTNEMSEKRDKLLMEALEDESLHYLVESFECIPVKSAYTGQL
jgi:hypothetical protein